MHKFLVSFNELLSGPVGGQTVLLQFLLQIAIREQVVNNFGQRLPLVSRTAKGKGNKRFSNECSYGNPNADSHFHRVFPPLWARNTQKDRFSSDRHTTNDRVSQA